MTSAAAGQSGELVITLPELHQGQRRVLAEMEQYNFLVAGRRWRKTTLCMDVMVNENLEHPAEYVWAAPTYKQVRRGWEEMKRATQGVVEFNAGLMEARFPNGSVTHFLSTENYDNIRGFTSFGTVIDEASEVARDAYTTALRPQLFGTDGWMLAIGTPKGRNWFFDEVQLVLAGERANSAAWQIPTYGAQIVDGRLVREPHPYENPSFTFDLLLAEYQTLPERVFRQEYLAEFLDDAGGVFRGVDRCIRGELLNAPPHAHARYAIGIDLAKRSDYTVCVVMDLDRRQVVAFDRFNLDSWPLQKARILTLARKWNNALVWMDTTGLGDPIYDDLHRAGLRIHAYTFTHATKQALIENAVLLTEQQQVGFPNIPVMIGELKAFEYQLTPSGRVTMAAPEGLHDDCVIGFALACWPLAHGGGAHIPAEAIEQVRKPVSEIGGTRILRRTF